MTPNAPISKANDLIGHINADSLVLPRIQSSRHSQVSSSVNGLARVGSRQRLQVQQNLNPNLRNYSRGEELNELRLGGNKGNGGAHPVYGSRHRQNNHLYNYMNGPKASDLSQQLDSLANSPSSLGINDRHLRQIRSRSNQAREEFSAL